jgi:type III secretory pathway component EscT
MTPALAPSTLLHALAPALLCGLRLLPVAMTSPLLGGPLAPAPARIALALGLGGCAARLTGACVPAGAGAFAGAAALELGAGALLAFLAAVPVEAARAAGRLTDTLRGATLAELHVAPIRQRESASGDLLAQWVVVLAAWAGADRLLVRGLLGSFAALPPGAPLAAAATTELALRGVAELTTCAVALAAPAAAGVLAADLVLGLASRASPSVSVSGAGPQARAALGLALLAAAASGAAGRLVSLVASAAETAGSLGVGGPRP